jgi:NADH:ubiquinone oxidoreductase subunit 6 (subunit J)
MQFLYSIFFTSYKKILAFSFFVEKKINLLNITNKSDLSLTLQDNFKVYGVSFFTEFYTYFILGGFILLIAMIGSIMLTLNYYDRDFKYNLISKRK